jgi:hypothetical protein
MTEADFRKMFPRASQACINQNAAIMTMINDKKEPTQMPQKLIKGRSMSNAELEYAMILEHMKRRGEIESYRYEGVTLKLADGCRFTPDFFVVVSSMILRLRFVEIKGRHIWEDSIVKFKVAKEQNPWAEWQMHQRSKDGQWSQIR